MDATTFHQFLDLDCEIKQMDGKIKALKEKRSELESAITSDLVESGLTAVVIGNRQIGITQKTVASVHSKAQLLDFLRERKLENFIKTDVDESALSEYINEIFATSQTTLSDPDDPNGEGDVVNMSPEEFKLKVNNEFNGLVSPYTMTKLKVTKAKK